MKKSGYLLLLVVACLQTLAFGRKFYFTPHVVSSETRKEWTVPAKRSNRRFDGLAVAVLHGMGDSCFNSGMQRITEVIASQLPGAYVKCVPIGDNFEEDTLNAFALTMNEQVELFAEKIMEDPMFANGFNALGISQGNLQIRGYVQKFAWRDDFPSVDSFIAIHGPLMGVAAFPGCDPSSSLTSGFCELLSTITAEMAYTKFIQNSLAQSNYFRDPLFIPEYMTTDFLPFLNNEKGSSEVRGLDSLNEMVLVKALNDNVIFPRESQWFGFCKDGSYDDIETFEETIFYQNDMFGLKTMDKAGKIHFETTPDDHVQFTTTFLMNLVQKYWG